MSKAEQSQSVELGSVIAGTYQIAGILGRGGMGSVWEATHLRLPGKRVAIKVLHANIAEDPESLARFRREAEIACRLGHPNIVEVHDFNHLEDNSPYLVLELLEGQSLDQRLREGRIDLPTCQHIARQIGSALQCAHGQDVVHRDLKPQNIFLVPSTSDDGLPTVKVLDFGISKIRGSQTVKTQDSTLLGTPQYMAPEQATGSHDSVDARTDLFALGAMLYELLSGRPAFSGQSIPEVVYKVVHVEPEPLRNVVPELPASSCEAIHKALQKSQDDRFPDIASFVEAFTGSALGPPRGARASRPAQVGHAATIDSSKMELGEAATFDSRREERVQTSAQVADPIAETIDSSKLDRLAASIEVTGAQVESVEIKSVARQERTSADGGKRKTYVITMVLVCGAALVALLAVPWNKGGEPKPPATTVAIVETLADKSTAESREAKPKEPETNATERTGNGRDSFVVGGMSEGAGDAGLDASVLAASDAADADGASSKKPAADKNRDDEILSEEAAVHLEQAQRALLDGRPSDALFAAKRAYRAQPNQRSLVIQAKALCLNRHMGHVQAALRKLPKRKHAQIRKFCSEAGFPLP